MTMFVVTHKRLFEEFPIGYKKMLVGPLTNDVSNEYSDYLKDNMGGENIASKNKNYCELTALYWIYRNSSAKYVGISHYRRFFIMGHVLREY